MKVGFNDLRVDPNLALNYCQFVGRFSSLMYNTISNLNEKLLWNYLFIKKIEVNMLRVGVSILKVR